jgi:hypothetical protein
VIHWNENELHQFWRFVAERNRMFLRRVVWRLPPPWTDEPPSPQSAILASTRFTNVYRELDRATRYLMTRILPKDSEADVIWNVIVFRVFGLIETYEALGGFRPATEWNPERVLSALTQRQRCGDPIFTSAYRVSQRGAVCGVGEKPNVVVAKLTEIHQQLNHLVADLTSLTCEIAPDIARHMKLSDPTVWEAYAALKKLPGLGDFMAGEIVTDLSYPASAISDDPADLENILEGLPEEGFVAFGSGAKRGLDNLVASPRPVPYDAAAWELEARQERMLRDAGANLYGCPRLSLRNVVFCCCEWSKYIAARDRGHRKRLFRSERANQDFSLWDNLPAIFRPALRHPWRPERYDDDRQAVVASV